jgi:hypothetical protein
LSRRISKQKSLSLNAKQISTECEHSRRRCHVHRRTREEQRENWKDPRALIAISSLRGEPISKTLAQDAIRNIAKEEESGAVTMQQILKARGINLQTKRR